MNGPATQIHKCKNREIGKYKNAQNKDTNTQFQVLLIVRWAET